MFADVPIMGVGDNSQQGRAYIFSGADGSLLLTLDTPDPQGTAYFGASVAVSDVNGGRKGDIVVGAPLENVGGKLSQGRAYVFSSPSPVGGIAEPPDVAKTSADEARAPTEDSGWSAGGYAALAGGLAATAAAIATGGWYARRRRHHRAS
jgi:hypothetical protein